MFMAGVLAITIVFWVLAAPEDAVNAEVYASIKANEIKPGGTVSEFDGRVYKICLEGHEYFYAERGYHNLIRAGLAPQLDDVGKPIKCHNAQ